jgi:hypothetical protein
MTPVSAVVSCLRYLYPLPSADGGSTQVYTIRLLSGDLIEAPVSHLRHPSDLATSLDSQLTTHYQCLPPWISLDQKVTLEIDGQMVRGYLVFDGHHRWCFEQRARNGKVITFSSLSDLPLTWSERVNEGTLIPGWQSPSAFHSTHVSATSLQAPCPTTLRHALDPTSIDRDIWLASYTEEFNSLLAENVMETISHSEYLALRDKCGHALPTMCVLCVKKDSMGRPSRAKSRIVVLGNLDRPPGQRATALLRSFPNPTSAFWWPLPSNTIAS